MKRKNVLLLATALIALVAVSCNWFNKPKSSAFLEGRWRLDSIHTDKDSGDAALAVLLFAFAQKDSNRIALQFTKDSVFTLENDSITGKEAYFFDKDRGEIQAGRDSAKQVFVYQKPDDSILVLKSSDSVSLHLRRE